MNSEIIFPLILAATLLVVLIFTVRLLRAGRQVLAIAFFAFAAACSLLSALYWVAYDLLRPEARMPFAANEICEWALFLLLASCLRAVFPGRLARAKAIVPAALFAAANTGLWIAWSGEWVQDVLTGLCLGWFLCVLLACGLDSGAMSPAEWTILGGAAFALIVVQVLTFFLPAAVQTLETVAAVIMFTADGWLILKTGFFLKQGGHSRQALCLSFGAFAWSTVAMYMSSGPVYLAAMISAALCYLLMLLAMQKEAAA